MSPQITEQTPDPSKADPAEAGPAAGRWEPCTTFAPHGRSSVCAECGWLDDDHGIGLATAA